MNKLVVTLFSPYFTTMGIAMYAGQTVLVALPQLRSAFSSRVSLFFKSSGEFVAPEFSQDLLNIDINCPQWFLCCLMFFAYIILLKLSSCLKLLFGSLYHFTKHHKTASLLHVCTLHNWLISYFWSITSIARSLWGSFFLLNEMAMCQCFGAVSNSNERLNILASSSSVLWLFENIWLDAICSWWFIYVLFVNLF